MKKEQIGKIIEKKWKEAGWTMYRLWQNSGVKVGPIQTIFDGSKKYTFDSLLAVCKALEIEICFNVQPETLSFPEPSEVRKKIKPPITNTDFLEKRRKLKQ